jgi:hypothetical protein
MAEDLNILDTIRDLKKREPFVPFWIVMSSGERYLIENGDLFVIGETQVFYCYPRSDRLVWLRMNQISSVELAEQRPAA